jgi:hypothetical protein
MSWNLLRLFTPFVAWDSLTLEEPMSVGGDTELKVPVGSVELAESTKIMLERAKIDKISTGMVLQRSIFDILNRLYGVVRGELFGLSTFSPIKLGRGDLEKSSNVIKRQEVSINSD